LEVADENFEKLVKRRKGAYKAQVALCESFMQVVITGKGGCCSGIDKSMSDEHREAFHRDVRGSGGTVLCVSLKYIMAAIG